MPVAKRLEDQGPYRRYRVQLNDVEGEVFTLPHCADDAIVWMVRELQSWPTQQ